MFRTLPGNVQDMTGKFLGNVRETSRKCSGHFQLIPGRIPGTGHEVSLTLRKYSSNIREHSRKFPVPFRDIPCKFSGQHWKLLCSQVLRAMLAKKNSEKASSEPKSTLRAQRFQELTLKSPNFGVLRVELSREQSFPTFSYTQCLLLVVLIVVNMFGFLVIIRSPLPLTVVNIGGNSSYKPPGAF